MGWVFSPVAKFLMEKLLSYLYDASKELKEMRSGTMPRLKLTLDQVLEYRMLLELSEKKPDKSDKTNVNDLDALLRDLKNSLYAAEENVQRGCILG